MFLCVWLVAQGCAQAEIGILFIAGLMFPEAGLLDEWPLDLPKIDALDLRCGSEFERFLAARLKKKELECAGLGRAGALEPFPSGWYAAC
jgi:hypothetical protein